MPPACSAADLWAVVHRLRLVEGLPVGTSAGTGSGPAGSGRSTGPGTGSWGGARP